MKEDHSSMRSPSAPKSAESAVRCGRRDGSRAQARPGDGVNAAAEEKPNSGRSRLPVVADEPETAEEVGVCCGSAGRAVS